MGPDDHDRIPEAVPPLTASDDVDFAAIELGERIGTGGDADVYRATVEGGGTVAVKQPRFEGTIQKRAVEKFENEAETWARLDDHDNVVTVYGWGTEPLPWLALEYMDGGTLAARLGDLDPVEALWLAGRVTEGVRHGHRHGVAHLDLKPTNLLLRETGPVTWDCPKVSDWGLAKLLLRHSNSVEGTFAHVRGTRTVRFGNVRERRRSDRHLPARRGGVRAPDGRTPVHGGLGSRDAKRPAGHSGAAVGDRSKPAPGGRRGGHAGDGKAEGRPLRGRPPVSEGTGSAVRIRRRRGTKRLGSRRHAVRRPVRQRSQGHDRDR